MTDAPPPVQKRKLIEVALPLEVINRESAREKSIRKGHPSTLHLWWSRKPLATARAVLFAQLVDDPSSDPERFPTEADVVTERKRLHGLLEQLVAWENSDNKDLLRQAHQEILDSTEGNPPTIHDPFSGGGSIALEAQRLGLDVDSSDINPVAVLINKALLEIPGKFANRAPVNPGSADIRHGRWPRATGIANDIRFYGTWMRDKAEQRIGHCYPKANLSDGTRATVIAWIWARTVTCPNPACQIKMPLTSKWWLSKKKGRETWVIPSIINGVVQYRIGRSPDKQPPEDDSGTVGRAGARCIHCKSSVDLAYIREEGRAGRMGADMLAVVAEGQRTRHYLAPTEEQLSASRADYPDDHSLGEIALNPRWFSTPGFGMTDFSDLFSPRQLNALLTLSNLVSEARDQIEIDCMRTGQPQGERLAVGGLEAAAYADAVATYLGMAVSNVTDDLSTIVAWRPSHGTGATRSTFARQAIPMTWDFAEANPFSGTAGDFANTIPGQALVLESLPAEGIARVSQVPVQQAEPNGLLSTDPPYYDNIGYSDLSDYFYVWLRQSLATIHPDLFSTMLVPKHDELVANPYRHGGKDGARNFFESGFAEVFGRARATAVTSAPITVYYAFKQSETTNRGSISTGWETFLQGMVSAGWRITATWPMRSERAGRMLSVGTNALASSIVIALRPREANAPRLARRGFVAALRAELPHALREMQQGAIAPVDLSQAAIGPGMAVFSRYSAVLSDDGAPMSVGAALSLINEVLDEVLSEQEGDFDTDTRFALAWFRQHGFDSGDFGDADNLARARNASLEHLDRAGILTLRGTRGKVTLLSPASLNSEWDPATDRSISAWEVVMHLSRTLTENGIVAASALLKRVPEAIDRDLCKELAFLLFVLAEEAKRTKVAVEFNALGTAWNDIVAGADRAAEQGTFDYTGN